MPEYLAPGVYVEETSFRSKSIEGVSTTTTGFIGPCRYGPLDLENELITSLAEFQQAFGDGEQLNLSELGLVHNYLWHAVRAFFIEGGKRLYITRVYRRSDGKKNGFSSEASAGEPPYADGYARAPKFPASADETTSILIRARYPGQYGNFHVRLILRTGQDMLRKDLTVGGLKSRDVVVVTRKESGAGEDLTGFYVADETPQGGITLTDTRKTPEVKITPAALAGYELRLITLDVLVDETGQQWEGLALDTEHKRSGVRDAVDQVLGFDEDEPTRARGVPIVVDPGDNLKNGLDILHAIASQDMLKALKDPKSTPESRTRKVVLLGGDDGSRPGSTEYAGEVNETTMRRTGLAQFEDIEDISIVAAPGSTFGFDDGFDDEALTIIGLLTSHADRMRYRIAVLDSGNAQSIAKVREMRAKLDSKYAAMYYPWIRVLDPITRAPIVLPPSGFVAGIYARNDTTRAVYKAPANEVVNLAIGFEIMLNKAQQDVLNPEGINAFRFFEGRGYRLWGARTISSDPEWKYVNLRRYFAYLERSIDKGTQWAVFEPNGEQLWANVRRTIEDFLLNEWQSGALLGDKPEKSFFVRCDRSTMTQNDLDNGRLICLIGVAPLRPAEFVIFRIGQWTADRKS